MLIVTIEPRAVDCKVELDGVDISQRVRRLEIDADVQPGVAHTTVVRLTLLDSAVVVGEAGRFEFVDARTGSEL